MKSMFLSVVLLASLDKGQLSVEHPQVAFKAPAVFGKSSTPTPSGVYLISKAYSTHLGMNILVFKKEDKVVWAIHTNLKSRTRQLQSSASADNFLSGGCIGVDERIFNKLWNISQPMVLQVY